MRPNGSALIATTILVAGILLLWFFPLDPIVGVILLVVGIVLEFRACGYSWICPKCRTKAGNIL
jgi:hypothetical protein